MMRCGWTLLLLLSAPMALAQTASTRSGHDYPAKPIRVVLSSPAGSAADIVARTVTNKLVERWGQQIVVDARPGGSGIIATEIVARAAPNGYTLLVPSSGSHGVNPGLHQKLPYDAVRDFAHVTLLVRMPLLLALNPSVPARNVKELIALAKAKPGQLNFASSGTGTTTHLAGELLKSMAGIEFLHVPYKGSQPALLETISGQASMNIAPILTALPHAKAGRLRAIAMTTPARSSIAPEVPTVSEAGVPGYEATLWFGLSAPAGTPRAIIESLNREVTAILKLTDVRDSLQQQGADAAGGSADEFTAYVKSEVEKWGKVVKLSGARPE